MTYYIEAYRIIQKVSDFNLAKVKWTSRAELQKGINTTEKYGGVTICYFRVKLKN